MNNQMLHISTTAERPQTAENDLDS